MEEGIAVRDPATGATIDVVPCHSPAEVEAAAQRARAAQPAWAALSVRRRQQALRRARAAFVRERREIVELLARETGKTSTDCVGEAIAVCLDIGAACRYAPAALRTRRAGRRLPLGKKRYIRHVPYGVVGVIGPWNAPLTLALGDAIYALAAGNTAVVKPSEVTPLAVRRAVEVLAAALPTGVLQVVTGDARSGAALVDCVDMICVTGSPATGRCSSSAARTR
jgi:acyl-CoA reductase-like NAD-dependent aldehyde dehydrogenase